MSDAPPGVDVFDEHGYPVSPKLLAYRRADRLAVILGEEGIHGVTMEDLAGREITVTSVRAVAEARDGEVATALGFAHVEDYRDVRERLARGERPAPSPQPEWMTETAQDKADRAYREALERRRSPNEARAAYAEAMIRG